MTNTEIVLERIANSLESIASDGLRVNIHFPDDVDKFVTDLPAMKICDAISEVVYALNDIER